MIRFSFLLCRQKRQKACPCRMSSLKGVKSLWSRDLIGDHPLLYLVRYCDFRVYHFSFCPHLRKDNELTQWTYRRCWNEQLWPDTILLVMISLLLHGLSSLHFYNTGSRAGHISQWQSTCQPPSGPCVWYQTIKRKKKKVKWLKVLPPTLLSVETLKSRVLLGLDSHLQRSWQPQLYLLPDTHRKQR